VRGSDLGRYNYRVYADLSGELTINRHIYIYFFLVLQPSAGYGLIVLRGFLITHNEGPQSVGLLRTSDQSVAETSTWQYTQQTNIHVPGGIRTHDRSRRAAVDLGVRPRGIGNLIFWLPVVINKIKCNTPVKVITDLNQAQWLIIYQ
jgi:hypothetical protein